MCSNVIVFFNLNKLIYLGHILGIWRPVPTFLKKHISENTVLFTLPSLSKIMYLLNLGWSSLHLFFHHHYQLRTIIPIFDTVLGYLTYMLSAYQRWLKEVFGKHCLQKIQISKSPPKKGGGVGIWDSIQIEAHFLTVRLSLSHMEHYHICLV